jgi:hypothetical protein
MGRHWGRAYIHIMNIYALHLNISVVYTIMESSIAFHRFRIKISFVNLNQLVQPHACIMNLLFLPVVPNISFSRTYIMQWIFHGQVPHVFHTTHTWSLLALLNTYICNTRFKAFGVFTHKRLRTYLR